MAAVLLVVYWRTGSLRSGLLASLLWGKLAAGVLWVLGVDYVVFHVYVVGENGAPGPSPTSRQPSSSSHRFSSPSS